MNEKATHTHRSAFLAAAIVLCMVAPSLGATNTGVIAVNATVSGTNSLQITLLNKADDQSSGKVFFGSTSGVVDASQYAKVEFDSNALGARVILRTDNKNNNNPFTGSGEGAGLVGTTNTAKSVPLLWAVFPDLTAAKQFVFKADTDPDATGVGSLPGATPRPAGEAEGQVVDKANPDFETGNVLGFATVVLPTGSNGLLGNFPTDEDGAGPGTGLRSANSPVFVTFGSTFVDAIAQAYGTTTLAFDLVVQ